MLTVRVKCLSNVAIIDCAKRAVYLGCILAHCKSTFDSMHKNCELFIVPVSTLTVGTSPVSALSGSDIASLASGLEFKQIPSC